MSQVLILLVNDRLLESSGVRLRFGGAWKLIFCRHSFIKVRSFVMLQQVVGVSWKPVFVALSNLSLRWNGDASKKVGYVCTRGTPEAQVFHERSGFFSGAIVDFFAPVEDQNFVEQIEDTITGLCQKSEY